MKKFKFRLEPILKLKKLEEDKLKFEIGKIQVKIESYKKIIHTDYKEIEMAYQTQEKELLSGAKGEDLSFYPYFESGKKARINHLNTEIKELEEEKSTLLEKLAKARATVKVYDQLKEKERQDFRKKILKKQNEKIEEQTLSWYHQRNKIC